MQSTRGAFHPTRFGDLAVTVDFHCQSACRFCIVREGMNHYRGLPLARFSEIASENRRSRTYERVIFTGGEVTLEPALFDFVRVARECSSFEHVRVQTNARRLADRDFARRLVDAGVDEYFVSLHGASAAVQDGISQREGSFDEAVRGLLNLRELGVRTITNTVMNADNTRDLPLLPALFASLGVSRMELWNYLPMEDTEEAKRLIAPMRELVPALALCLEQCELLDVEVTTKYVPRCLLGRFAHTLDNGQPDVVIVESFWDTFPAFNCLYEAICDHSEECLGLHHPYVNTFGWEENRLRPTPRSRPWEEQDGSRRESVGVSEPWAALVEGVPDATPGRLERAWLTRNEARYRYVFEGGGSVEIVLAPRDDGQPALARSTSFNVFYTALDARAQSDAVRARVSAAARSVLAADDGSLSLDATKGLPREHVRRRRSLPTTR
jgi:MoaA/NifB/PqqE/SkfB family radical SAM enzyme